MSLMSNSKSMNIARLMTSYNFEIKELPDNLKCTHCKSVLNDACQVPCGCTFCRKCIDDMMSNGEEFCPNVSQDCGYASLASAVPDYRANKAISLLTVKCPYHLCEHECPLVNMEQHLRKCQKNGVECPFRELGCTQGRLATEEMDRHLQLDNRRHTDILIGIVANVNREMEASKRDIEMMKRELVLKDGQIRTIMDQMIHVVNENKSIKQENEELIDRVRVLSDKIERCESDELGGARLSEHLDKEITSIKEVMESNKDESRNEMNSVLDDIQSIKDDICSMKPQRQSLQELVGQGEVDATCEWVIGDVWKTHYKDLTSEAFSGKLHLYRFQLVQMNRGIIGDVLRIYLRCIHSGNDELVWPFTGRVVISVADKDNREACKTISRECQISKPNSNTGVYGCTDYFVFRYSELTEAGLDLSHGLCVLCQVVPGLVA